MENSYDMYAYGEKVIGTLDDARSIACEVEEVASKNTNGAMNELANKIIAINARLEKIEHDISVLKNSTP